MMKLLGEEVKLRLPRDDFQIEIVKKMLEFIDSQGCSSHVNSGCSKCPFKKEEGSCVSFDYAKERDIETYNALGNFTDARYKEIKIKLFKEYINYKVSVQEEIDV